VIVSLSPTDSQIFSSLVGFLQTVLPQGGATFSGSIAGTNLTVTKVTNGVAIEPGDAVFSTALGAVAAGTLIVSQTSGTAGGPGVYVVNVSQSVSGSPLNTGVPILKGQQNRIAQPPAPNYVIMTPLRRPRLATNIDDAVDCYFQASIAAKVLTVSSVAYGTIELGSQLFGVGITANTVVLSQLTGSPPGGIGTYSINNAQTVSAEGMACGTNSMLQKLEVVAQLDVYGPGSADLATIISTAFRDEYGVDLFAASGFDVAPLYADDPRQIGFIDGEVQWEERWIIEAHIQANVSVVVPQQFAAVLSLDLVNVDVEYPPT
jgi:hypothetical protein